MSQKVLSINGVPVQVEVSDTERKRQQGLMGRRHLSPGTGMLFVFPKEQGLGFWMKNTMVPLSIAFISKSGQILNIEEMYPYDLTTVRSQGDALCALEVPSGWFKRNGIHPGDIVNGIEDKALVTESRIREIIREFLK
jgi:uncharacterized protein